MSRYIDAELLIEAMQGRKFANDECVRHGTDSLSKEYYRHLQFEDGIMMGFVREQPTADVKPVVHGKWTPVSERLPKPGETEGNITKYYLVQGEYGDRFVACYDGHKWQQIFHYDCEVEEEVVAWMPLPEPYKVEMESEE